MTDDEWDAVLGVGARPAIRLYRGDPGAPPHVLDEVQRALIGAGHNIFVRGRGRRGLPQLVRFDHGGFYRSGDAPVPVDARWLRHHMAQAADFFTQVLRKDGTWRRRSVHPPPHLARLLLARSGEWRFRSLPEDPAEWPALIAGHRREPMG